MRIWHPELKAGIILLYTGEYARLSIPSVSIPYGQRFIEVDFARADQIVQQLHAYDPSLDNPAQNLLGANAPTITTCELWINNIFVNPEIHDIFIKRIGFSLIRVYRRQIYRVNKATDNILLAQLKWPIETLYIGMRPTANTNVLTSKLLTCWNMYCRIEPAVLDLCSLANGYNWGLALAAGAPYPTNAALVAALTANFNSYTGNGLDFAAAGLPAPFTWNQLNAVLTENGYPALNLGAVGVYPAANPNTQVGLTLAAVTELVARTPTQPQRCKATYDRMLKTIDTIQIEAHGVPLYRVTPVEFFNQYVPYTYGGHHINTPVDIGALMVTFNLYPGSYQPSGHVNVSRAREFYYQYASSWISEVNTADMVVVAIAINFLLISDGSAVLRYST